MEHDEMTLINTKLPSQDPDANAAAASNAADDNDEAQLLGGAIHDDGDALETMSPAGASSDRHIADIDAFIAEERRSPVSLYAAPPNYSQTQSPQSQSDTHHRHQPASPQPYIARPSTDTPTTRPATTTTTTVTTQNDGVFSNMAAKPDAPAGIVIGKVYEDIEPPSYIEAVGEPHPFAFDTAITATIADDGEILIDGYPVGDMIIFVVNMFVSLTFDFLGFLITSLLATSHAAKLGSQAGFGLTLIRIGVFVRDGSPSNYGNEDDESGGYVPDPVEQRHHREFISFVMIIVGFFVLIRSFAEYVRVNRMKQVIQISSVNALAAGMSTFTEV